MVVLSATGPFNCDFTQGTCGWTQDRGDDFNWLRTRGTTTTQGTGPNSDHTSGSELTWSFK